MTKEEDWYTQIIEAMASPPPIYIIVNQSLLKLGDDIRRNIIGIRLVGSFLTQAGDWIGELFTREQFWLTWPNLMIIFFIEE